MPKRTQTQQLTKHNWEQTMKKDDANYILTDFVLTAIKNGIIDGSITMLVLEGSSAGTTQSMLNNRGIPLHLIIPNNSDDYQPLKKIMKTLCSAYPNLSADVFNKDAYDVVQEGYANKCNVVYLDFCRQLTCNTAINTCLKTVRTTLESNQQKKMVLAVTYSEVGARNSNHSASIKMNADKTNLSKLLLRSVIAETNWSIMSIEKKQCQNIFSGLEDVDVFNDHIHLGPYGPNKMNTLYFVLEKVFKPQTTKINRFEKEIVRCLKKDTLCKVCGHVCPWKGSAASKKLVVCCTCEDSDSSDDTCVYSDSSEDEESTSDEEIDESEDQTYTGEQLQKLVGKKCEVKWRGKWALANVVELDGCALQWIEDTYYEPTKVSKKSKWCVRNVLAQNKFIGFLEQDELKNFVGETFSLYWCEWLKVKMLKIKNKNYAHFEILSGAKKGTQTSFRMSSTTERLGVCNPVMMSKQMYKKYI